jgi:hypothetical protein
MVVYEERGDLPEMQGLVAEALGYMKATGARRARSRFLFMGSELARHRGDLTQAAVYLSELAATPTRSQTNRGIVAFSECCFAQDVGDVAKAVAHGRNALSLLVAYPAHASTYDITEAISMQSVYSDALSGVRCRIDSEIHHAWSSILSFRISGGVGEATIPSSTDRTSCDLNA